MLYEFSKEIVKLLLENDNKQIIVAYPGRFQPFHKGHFISYTKLISEFGKDNVYIVTSDITDQERSPLSFEQKKNIMTRMFNIPNDKIIKVKSPYKAIELYEKFPVDSTVSVFALGHKDADRLNSGKYFLPYKKGQTTETVRNHGYIYILPPSNITSGTKIREMFRSGNEIGKKKLFMEIYSKFDTNIYNLLNTEFNKKQEIAVGICKYENINEDKILLTCGASYGHIPHLFENMDLSFGEMRDIIEKSLSGNLEYAREKTDGQQLSITWKDEKLRSARNKGQLKNFGENSLDIEGISKMFDGRGEIKEAFVLAMQDLQSAISKLPINRRESLFQNGKKFMSVEIIYPATKNVIPYGASLLIFHSLLEYDINGNLISSSNEDAMLLNKLIKNSNLEVQKTFQIQPLNPAQFEKDINFKNQVSEFNTVLNNIISRYTLNDSNTLYDYVYSSWKELIDKNAEGCDYSISTELEEKIINKFVGKDSTTITSLRKNIPNKEFISWINQTCEQKQSIEKSILKPFEILFLKLGVRVLKNVKVLLSANPKKSLKDMKHDLAITIKQISSSGDANKLEKLKMELRRLKSIGSFDDIVPIEGITFMYNGKIYKLTGTFAPINQILGILRYGK